MSRSRPADHVMISLRFGRAVGILLGLALIPTLIHSYLGLANDDGRATAHISSSLAGMSSQPTSRRAAWVNKTYASEDWIERRYSPTGSPRGLVLFVARSDDLKRLYHHPELGVLSGTDLRDEGLIHPPDRRDMPVRVLRGTKEAGGLVVYSLLYGDRFVENPYWFQLQTSWTSLVAGRQHMTLFLVHDALFPPNAPLKNSPALQLLLEAVRSFLSQSPRPMQPVRQNDAR